MKPITDCPCGRVHKCDVEITDIADGAVQRLEQYCEKYNKILIVCDDNTLNAHTDEQQAIFRKISYTILKLRPQTDVVVPDETKIAEIEEALAPDTDLIVGVGSGVINDLCKYVSFHHDLPYYIVATAPSMDGYASVGAAMILKGMKETVNCRTPKAIIAEPEVLCKSPIDMIRAGYGDIIGKYSCLNDWRLAGLVLDEYICEFVYDFVANEVEKVAPLANKVAKRDPDSVSILMQALVNVGIAMSYVGNSRPASGSEHHFAHYFEITGILNNREYFFHGIDVAYAAVVTASLREKILAQAATAPEKISLCPTDEKKWQEDINRIYKTSAPEVMALQKKIGLYGKQEKFGIKENFDRIAKILLQAPSSEYMMNLINDVGLSFDTFVEKYGTENINDAIMYAKDLKDRYTVLWLYYEYFRNGD